LVSVVAAAERTDGCSRSRLRYAEAPAAPLAPLLAWRDSRNPAPCGRLLISPILFIVGPESCWLQLQRSAFAIVGTGGVQRSDGNWCPLFRSEASN